MSSSPFQNFLIRYDAGERIFSEGDLGTTMYIVQSGKVRLFRMVEEDKRIHGIMEKGDFFGEMSILEGLPRTTSAEAVEDAELIEINSMTFDKMIQGNIEIAIRMLRKLSIRLRELETRIEHIGKRPTPRAAPPARIRPVVRPGGPPPAARIEVLGEDAAFAIGDSDVLIGRYDPVTEMAPDIDLTPVDLKRTVSRRHARISQGNDGYSIVEEVGAQSGTFVNGEKLVTGEPKRLENGDQLHLGSVKLVFRLTES